MCCKSTSWRNFTGVLAALVFAWVFAGGGLWANPQATATPAHSDTTHVDSAHAAANTTTAHADAHGHAQGSEHGKEEKLEVAALLFDHILDSHDWHLLDYPSGTTADGKIEFSPVSIPLPYILYSSKGLDIFFAPHHGHGHGHHEDPLAKFGYKTEGRTILTQDGEAVWDFSITKTVVQMMLIVLLLLIVFLSVAASYRRRKGQAPKGLQSLFEPIILFVRDDIAKENLHGKHEKFVPYLLTLFFFIWFSNLFGLTPLNSNIAGNISVTVALAVLTFFLVQFNASKDYWVHIFWTPGVPHALRLIMLPVEIIGVFTKPFSLTIRLFANITGGHFMVLALVSLIFILGENGTNPSAAYTIAPLSLAFGTFIFCLEFLVALIQAYIFTLLTAVFIGMAMETHEHEHDHEHGAEHAHH